MASNSKNTGEYMYFKIIPDNFNLMQYYNAFLRTPSFLVMFLNSIILTVPIVIGQLLVSMPAAYAFAKLNFPFKDKIFFIYIVIMLMPYQVTLVPNFIVLRFLGLIGTRASVILPGIFSTFGVFLMTQFIKSIPNEQCEAAQVDGASQFP
jgi:multiple sugar transport system permease protein